MVIQVLAILIVASCAPASASGDLLWPMGSGYDPYPLSHQHGQFIDFYGSDTLHLGADLLADEGEAVYAVSAGIVADLFLDGPYTEIVIRSEDGLGFRYVHLDPESLQFDLCDPVEVDDYLGDVYGEYEEDPTHPSHLHFERVSCEARPAVVEANPRGGECPPCAGEWVNAGHSLLPLVELDADASFPVIVAEPGKEVLFYEDDADLGGATPQEIAPDQLTTGKVDVVVRIEDEFLGKTKLTPYQVTLELRKAETVVEVFHTRLDGALSGYDADIIFHPESKGSYEERAFYLVLTNGASTPDGSPDPAGHLDLSQLDGVFTLAITAWDLSAFTASNQPPTYTYSFDSGE